MCVQHDRTEPLYVTNKVSLEAPGLRMLLNPISDQSKRGPKQQTGADLSPRQGGLLPGAGEGWGRRWVGPPPLGKGQQGSKRARAGRVTPTASSGKAAGLGQNRPARLLMHRAALPPHLLQSISGQQPLSKSKGTDA